jgi:hypothetical protein
MLLLMYLLGGLWVKLFVYLLGLPWVKLNSPDVEIISTVKYSLE